jgi:hypothetical protein
MSRSHLLARAAAVVLIACSSPTDTQSFNAGDWTQPPFPSGADFFFSLDTSATVVRGTGMRTGIAGANPRSFRIGGTWTSGVVRLTFHLGGGQTVNYLGRFDGPDRMVGSWEPAGGQVSDSIVFLRSLSR